MGHIITLAEGWSHALDFCFLQRAMTSLVQNENTSCWPWCFNFHMCSVHCSSRKERTGSGQAVALWTVSLRNVQHVGNFMSMFGNFLVISYSAVSHCKQICSWSCLTYFCLNSAMYDLTVCVLALFVFFSQPRPWGTDTVNPPSLQSAVLRERRVPRPWCPSASIQRAGQASMSSRACSPTSPSCPSARSASSWLSRWWVVESDKLEGQHSLWAVLIHCCCPSF